MKKQYRETNGEVALEDVFMAAALMNTYCDEKGQKHKGLEFVRVQDTVFAGSKEIILRKDSDEHFEKVTQLYFSKKMRLEPHDYLNAIAELKDLIKARIKKTATHNTHKKIISEEEFSE